MKKIRRTVRKHVWLIYSMIINSILAMFALLAFLSIIALIGVIFVPNAVWHDWWVGVLCVILIPPLYFLKRHIDRRLAETKQNLDQVDSSDEPKDSLSR